MAQIPHDGATRETGADLLDARLALGDECAHSPQPSDSPASSPQQDGSHRLSVAARVAAPFAVAIVVMALIVLAVLWS